MKSSAIVTGSVFKIQRFSLQETLGFAYMIIAHDLAVILYMSSKVGVMYVGKW
jgi:ABC-type glutathione transport system ATPase component